MRRINVLQVSNWLDVGGIAQVLQHYTEHLNREIFNVTVAGLYKGGVREQFLREQGFPVHVLDGNLNNLVQLIREKHIDIIHLHQHGDLERAPLRAARAAQVPVVVETNVFGRLRGPASSDLPDMNFLVSKMCALRYKLWQKCSWEEFFKNSAVLYNPIVLSDFVEPDIPAQKELRQKYRIPEDALVIGRHGRPDAAKWGDICLDMLPYLLQKLPNVKYLALGLPPEKIRRIKARRREAAFRFFDPTDDFRRINEFLWLLDAFPYASVNGETFGLAIAEALACKKPVVVNSTPCKDNAQVELIDHGKNGLVANHPRAFAAALAGLLADPHKRREMGEAGRRKVEDYYEVKKNTLALEKRYVELLAAKGGKIDPLVRDKYENIKPFPSREEIVNFEMEYKTRIRNCFGRKNYLQIYLWELILRDFRKYNKVREIKQFIKL